MRPLVYRVLILASLAGACTAPAPRAADAPAPHADAKAAFGLSELEHAISVRDGESGGRLSFAALLDELARAEAVFLGESHIDETTHRVELAVYEGLLARRGGRVVLALEMFERDVQPVLDEYLAGRIDEASFLARARPWSNYRSAYRPLVERARAARAPVVAANFPAPLRAKVARDGLAALTEAEREQAPAELLPNSPGYWRRVDNAIRGHLGMMGPPPAEGDPRLTSTQSLWDNAMGDACAQALERHPEHAVLHVNGGFHTEYHDGTARQLQMRRPGTRARTVAIVPCADPASEVLEGLPVADFVVFAAEIAQDVDEGTWAVFAPRQLEYRLHVPPAAWTGAPLPLFVWLADDGESAADALALWKLRLGGECVLAVIEAPYRETQEDLVEGGRWYWPDSFREDVGALRIGIERTWGHLLRHQPVDPARVVLAGEGTGATVAAAATLLTDGLAVRALALAPRRYAALKDFPLPLPELRGDLPPVAKSLTVLAAPDDDAWWKRELAEYAAIGLRNDLRTLADDPWRDELEREKAVRTALGLAPRELPADAPRAHVVVGDSRRARAWARGLAHERAEAGELVALLERAPEPGPSRAIELRVRAADHAEGARLPRAPGPFGGTTVIVLSEDLPADEQAAWAALEADDPLAKASRAHRLVVARATGERTLAVVLADLAAKGRRNVLVVPATWIADGTTMRALQRDARRFEDVLTLHWRPGLGGL